MVNDVHTSHCCKWHGCKYGDDDCTVTLGAPQEYPCEFCAMDYEDYLAAMKVDKEFIAYMERQ